MSNILNSINKWKLDGEDFYVDLDIEIREPIHSNNIPLSVGPIWITDTNKMIEVVNKFLEIGSSQLKKLTPHLRAYCIDILSLNNENKGTDLQLDWTDEKILNAITPSRSIIYIDEDGEVFIVLVGNAQWNVDHGISMTWKLCDDFLSLVRVGEDDELYVNENKNFVYASSFNPSNSTIK